MAGGLMQLVAYGAQDVYLTGNPQITFFKVVYRRHTNFSMEASKVTMSGNPDFGRHSTVTITRNGDLINQLYLMVTLSAVQDATFAGKFAWVRRLGYALIKNSRSVLSVKVIRAFLKGEPVRDHDVNVKYYSKTTKANFSFEALA